MLTQNNDFLFRELANDDEQAFRELYEHYKAPFYAAAYRLMRSEQLAEEAVQETFLALWVKRQQVAESRNPHNYLLSMLHNQIYSQFRKIALDRKTLDRWVSDHPDQSTNPVEDFLLAKENREIIHSFLSQLPPQQEKVYRLSKLEGLSREEVAARLNISPNTVKNHLMAASEFLRTHFGKGLSAFVWLVIMEELLIINY